MPTPLKIPAIVEKIILHTNDVKSFIMKPLKPYPNFKPGQYLHLAIDEYDPSFHWPESRAFSLVNSPTRKDSLKITFSVKGTFTNRMFNKVKSGDKVWLKLPYGSFTFPECIREFVLIAGGTGITPFVSFLEYAIDKKLTNKIKLYYGVRSSRHVIFNDLLYECQIRLNHFYLQLFVEDGSKIKGFDKVNLGMLAANQILKYWEIKENSLCYLSGPPEMINKLKNVFMEKNISEENFRVDEWE